MIEKFDLDMTVLETPPVGPARVAWARKVAGIREGLRLKTLKKKRNGGLRGSLLLHIAKSDHGEQNIDVKSTSQGEVEE